MTRTCTRSTPYALLAALVLLAAPPAAAQILFEDVTVAAGLEWTHHPGPISGERPASDFGSAAAISDYDNDGDLDVYFVDSLNFPNLLYRNDGDGTFTEVGGPAGVADTGYGQMALFLDLDDDGFQDLIVLNNGNATSKLFRNLGDGTFADVTAGSGFAPFDLTWGGCGAGDYDKDGDLDVSVVGWNNGTTYFYRNEGDFQFTDVTVAAGAKPNRPPENLPYQWSVVHVDLDNDGWQDIFSAVDFSANYLLRNNQDGTFTEVSAAANMDSTSNDMGIAIADVDDDLDLDVYVTDITGSGSSDCFFPIVQGGCNTFHFNDGSGVFTDQADALGMDDTDWAWGTAFFDADLDGDRDLYVVNGAEAVLGTPATAFFYRNDGGTWVESAAAVGLDHDGDSKSLNPFDYDNDGDVDLLVTDTLGDAKLFRNVTPRGANRWLEVKAEGSEDNRDGVGARVFVTAGGATQMHEIVAGGSFYASPPLVAHFGLGPNDVATEVRVEYPRGRVVTLTDVAADQRVTVGPLGAVKNLRLEPATGATRLSWDAVPNAESYSIGRGALPAPAGGDYGACVDGGVAVTFWDEPDDPAPGTAWFYLVRAWSAGAAGPLGEDSSGAPRADADLDTCP